MSYYEKWSCRIAIQVCIGHFPDGRERHRTFSMRGINPDASPEAIAAVVRALAPVLAYPITKVRKVTKREIFFFEEAVLPVPVTAMSTETCRIIPFPVFPVFPEAERLVARQAAANGRAAILPFPSPLAEPSSRQICFFLGRAPPVQKLDAPTPS